MGADLYAWIEYDNYYEKPFIVNNECPDSMPLLDWVGLSGSKEYLFMGAISGCRNMKDIPPLIKLRGVPPCPSDEVKKYLEEYGEENMGWLMPAELTDSLLHHGIQRSDLSIEVNIVLNTIDFLVKELGSDRVRFVFDISSA